VCAQDFFPKASPVGFSGKIIRLNYLILREYLPPWWLYQEQVVGQKSARADCMAQSQSRQSQRRHSGRGLDRKSRRHFFSERDRVQKSKPLLLHELSASVLPKNRHGKQMGSRLDRRQY
jgi:hypothetical protein